MQRLRREKVHGIIFQRWDAGDADRRLHVFTRPYGLLPVMAKGVRRIPSRRGGHVEPLTHVVALLSGHAGYYYLAAVEPFDAYADLHAREEALECGQFLVSVISSLFGEGDPQPVLFDALHHALSALPHVAVEKRRVLEVAVILFALRQAGVLPELVGCAGCGERRPQEAVVLQARHGGWACLSCLDSFAGTVHSLPPQLLKALRWLVRYPERATQLALGEEHSVALSSALRSYVVEAQHVLTPATQARN